ncbi:MAG: carboxypeptidase-like regulatory domain-containing protein, partial [Gemmataceae bacterium]|nr:carboxypeptidase-like regulatory domain-containing protein [Gemmataceae bacterium]
MIRRGPALAFLAAIAFSAAGCGAKLVPAEGTITLDGKPLANANVTFVPEKGPSPVGTSDAQGKFKLTTGNKAGAPAGTYKVMVSLNTEGSKDGPPTGPDAKAEMMKKMMEKSGSGPPPETEEQKAISKYRTVEGGLTATVESGKPI